MLPLPHIHMWLTEKIMITSVSFDKTFFNKTVLPSACSHTTGLNLQIPQSDPYRPVQ
jgi:hypothetical protein